MFHVAIKTNETWLICGGRGFSDRQMFDDVMSQLLEMFGCPEKIIHGGADGADAMGAIWAGRMAIKATAFPADWTRYGKAAGPMRNQAMLEMQPNRVIAFPGGNGTADMVNRAKGRMPEITVIEIRASAHTSPMETP